MQATTAAEEGEAGTTATIRRARWHKLIKLDRLDQPAKSEEGPEDRGNRDLLTRSRASEGKLDGAEPRQHKDSLIVAAGSTRWYMLPNIEEGEAPGGGHSASYRVGK